MKKKKKQRKIQSRVITTTVASLLTMCLLVSLVSFIVFNNYLKESLVKSSASSLELLADSIDTNISSINSLVRFCQTNASISEYIKKNPNPGSVLSVATYDRLNEEYANTTAKAYIPRMAIITGEHFLQIVLASYSSNSDLAVEVPALDYFDILLNANDYDFSTGIIKDPFYSFGPSVIPLIRPITYQFNSVQGGCLFMEVNTTLFTDAFKKYATTDDSHLFLTVGEYNYIYNNGVLEEIDELPSKIVTSELAFKGCSISQSISSSELRHELLLLVAVIIGIVLSIIAIGVVMMFTLNRLISLPVLKLREKMNKISSGDFLRDDSIEWDTELGDIGRGINDLAENVNLLMESRLEDEKQKKDLEYKVLQSQINPHFLYNTLNSIKWMATVQGADGISEMTTALAKLLKSISKGTSSIVTIEEELNLLNEYFTIQSYRYGGTITMSVSCEDDTIKQCGIIKFTLQPIVENAIFHGIEPKGNGHIDVRVSYEENGICILVSDDGIGMSEDKIHALFTEDSTQRSDFFKELGVKNVHQRIQYEFGEEYGLSCESVEGSYTKMFIHIPTKRV